MLEDEGIVDSNLAANLLIHGVDEGLVDCHALLHSEKTIGFLKKFCGLECVSHTFVNVGHFVFLRDVLSRTQRAAVASRRATNLATHVGYKTI